MFTSGGCVCVFALGLAYPSFLCRSAHSPAAVDIRDGTYHLTKLGVAVATCATTGRSTLFRMPTTLSYVLEAIHVGGGCKSAAS